MRWHVYNRRWRDWPAWLRLGWAVATSDCGYAVLSAEQWGQGRMLAWGVNELTPGQQRWRLEYFKQQIVEDLERRGAKIAEVIPDP